MTIAPPPEEDQKIHRPKRCEFAGGRGIIIITIIKMIIIAAPYFSNIDRY